MDHGKRAREIFEGGGNCAQSVFTAYADLTGFSEEQALRMASAFGGGIGRLRETCGAVSGGVLVIGCLYGYSQLPGDEAKAEVYRKTQQFVRAFKAATGSMWCHELLGLETWPEDPRPSARTQQYYAARPCGTIIETGGRVLDQLIAQWGLPVVGELGGCRK